MSKIILNSALALSTLLPFSVTVAQAKASVTTQAAIEDTKITAKIKALYAKSPLLKASDIQVTTINQNVLLAGKVKTNSQYERAITLADIVPNVRAINVDNLSVKASHAPLTDTYITAKVKGNILKEEIFGSKAVEFWPVKVETKDTVVYLSGKVRSVNEQNNLIHLAQATSGVSEVKSSLLIQ